MAAELAELRKINKTYILHITNKLKTTHAQLHITECNSITYYMTSAQIQICPPPPPPLK
jgi:hypothetical protein